MSNIIEGKHYARQPQTRMDTGTGRFGHTYYIYINIK